MTLPPEQHDKLNRIVSGAIRDTLAMHPDYLSEKGHKSLANSLRKRLVGQLGSLITGEGRKTPHTAAGGSAPVAHSSRSAGPRWCEFAARAISRLLGVCKFPHRKRNTD